MLLYIAGTRRWSLLKEMKIPQGILLAFLVGLPWYVYMYIVHGTDFTNVFIGYHNITRFAAPEHPGQNSIFFFYSHRIGWPHALDRSPFSSTYPLPSRQRPVP